MADKEITGLALGDKKINDLVLSIVSDLIDKKINDSVLSKALALGDKKINDLALGLVTGTMQLETDVSGTVSNKITVNDLSVFLKTNTSFIDLNDTPIVYTNTDATYTVKSGGGLQELDILITEDAVANTFNMARGTTTLTVSTNCSIDQNLETTADVAFNGITLGLGTQVLEFSIDGTLVGDSDDAVPTEKAIKTYVDGHSGLSKWNEITGVLSPITLGNKLALGINTSNFLSQFHVNSASDAYLQFTNTTTGSTATDGFVLGIAADGKCQIQTFDEDIEFRTTAGLVGVIGGSSKNLDWRGSINITNPYVYAVNGQSINTAGVLTNVVYKNKVNTLTFTNLFELPQRYTLAGHTAISNDYDFVDKKWVVDHHSGGTFWLQSSGVLSPITLTDKLALGIVSSNYEGQIHNAAAADVYLQFTNSITTSVAGAGLLIGVDATGSGIINSQTSTLDFWTNSLKRGQINTNGKLNWNYDVNVVTGKTYQINNVDINTAGTLTNVAYKNQINAFTSTNTFNVNQQYTAAGHAAIDADYDLVDKKWVVDHHGGGSFWQQNAGVLAPDTLTDKLALGVTTSNYVAQFHVTGANASLLQLTNGTTGTGSSNGIFIGVSPTGTGLIYSQSNDLVFNVAQVGIGSMKATGEFDWARTVRTCFSEGSLSVGTGTAADNYLLQVEGNDQTILFTDLDTIEKSLELVIANSGGPKPTEAGDSRPAILFVGNSQSGSDPVFIFKNSDASPDDMLVIDTDGVILPRTHFFGMNCYRDGSDYKVWNSSSTTIGGYAKELVPGEVWTAVNQYLSSVSSNDTILTKYRSVYTKRAGAASPRVLCTRDSTVTMKDPVEEDIIVDAVYDTGILKYTGYIKAYNYETDQFANWQTSQKALVIFDPTSSSVGGIYANIEDNPGTINIYWKLTSGNPVGAETLHIQNKTIATKNVRVFCTAFYGFELSY